MPNIQNINIKATSYAMGLMPISVRTKFKILQISSIKIQEITIGDIRVIITKNNRVITL